MPEHLSEIILVLFTASLSNAVSMFQIQQVHSQSFEQDPLKRLLTRCKCNWIGRLVQFSAVERDLTLWWLVAKTTIGLCAQNAH